MLTDSSVTTHLVLGLSLGDVVASHLDAGLEEGPRHLSDRQPQQVTGLLGNWTGHNSLTSHCQHDNVTQRDNKTTVATFIHKCTRQYIYLYMYLFILYC